jgi:hypothetical protein
MRMKHVQTRLHLVLEAVQEGRLEIRYINMKEMIADGLTKPLDGADVV